MAEPGGGRGMAALAAALGLATMVAAGWQGGAAGQGAHGIDRAAMDRSVAPGDDFFRFANGSWLDRTEIPADRSRWGVFDVLGESSLERTRRLLERAAAAGAGQGAAARKAGDYYASVLDEAAIEAKGAGPLRPALARIDAIDGRVSLARVLGEDLRADVDPLNNTNFHTDRLFGLWVAPDLNDTSHYAPYLLQGGLDLPDREYYLADTPRMAGIRTAFEAHVAKMLALGGRPGAAGRARAVVALEQRIARVHATRLESLDVTKANNPWPRAEFATRAPGLDWAAFFAGAGLSDVPVVIVWHPAATTALSALVASEPLEAWKDWLAFHAADRMADVLPRPFAEERFAFHGRQLAGTPEQSPRWKRAVAATNGALGDAVGHLYARAYFPAATKARAQALVKGIVAAFGQRVDRLDWMSPGTKAKAREKLATLYVGVGYPDRWTDYTALEVVRGDAYGNADRASRFAYRRNLARLARPVDKTEWSMTPQTVNAVNLPLQNALNFPAAILEPPFFDAKAPDAVNYGAIGSVIGHEISHSFDDQGAHFDAQGRLANWWTADDFAHFGASGAQLAAQYDRYEPFPGVHVNGRLTLSENIADLAGLASTYDAWKASLGGRPAPSEGGLTGEQQLFLSFGQIWRAKVREALLRQLIITDGHAPGQYRAAIVRNLDPWYDAFHVRAGERLYLAPAERVRVW